MSAVVWRVDVTGVTRSRANGPTETNFYRHATEIQRLSLADVSYLATDDDAMHHADFHEVIRASLRIKLLTIAIAIGLRERTTTKRTKIHTETACS